MNLADYPTVKFERKEILHHEGEEMAGVYFLYSGKCKLTRYNGNRMPQVIRLSKSGNWLGLADLPSLVYNSSAIALGPVQAAFIPREDILKVMKQSTFVSLTIMQNLCKEIEETERRLFGFAQKNAKERVAETLLNLANTFGIDKQQFLDVSLPMRDFASFAGTSSETLSRLFREFQRQHFINVQNKRIQLIDPGSLKKIARIPGFAN